MAKKRRGSFRDLIEREIPSGQDGLDAIGKLAIRYACWSGRHSRAFRTAFAREKCPLGTDAKNEYY